MTCQNLIDKYSGDSKKSWTQEPAPSLSSRWLSKSCADLSSTVTESESVAPLRRSKSYSRITEERSAYDQQRESYRSTVRNMFTNIKDFSSRTVSAIGSDRTLRVGLCEITLNHLC